MQGRLNLRERLLVVMAVALLPLFAVVAWDGVRDHRAAADLTQSQLAFAASLLAAHQDRAVDAAEQLLSAIATAPDLPAMDPPRCRSWLQTLQREHPGYTNIALFDLQGQARCHALGDSALAVGDRDYFRKALAENRFVMGEPIVGRASRRDILPFALPVTERGKVVAVALAALDLQRAAQALASVQRPLDARVLVTDRHGHKVVEVGAVPDADDAQRIFALAHSRAVGDEGFIVRVGLSREALAHESWQRNREQLLTLGLVMLAAMAMVWWIGGRMIVKPAKQILGTVRRIEQGRLDARVPLHAGGLRGEFARIGAAFNLMADSLQMRQADLEAELGRSRGAYAALDQVLNSMQEGLVAVTADGKFMLYNAAALRLMPLADAPVLPELWPEHFGMYHADRVTPYAADDLPLVRSALGESEGQAVCFVRNSLVPEGRLLQCTWHAMEGGSVRGGLVVFADITELQRLQVEQEASLARLEEAQRKLVESQRVGRIGNWELDLRTGRMWWSEEVYPLLGIRPDEFAGDLTSFEMLVHPEDRPRLKPARDRALTENKVMNLEYRIVKPDGSIAWLLTIAGTRRNAGGEPVWFGGVVQDITERKLTSLENSRLLAELKELNAGLESRIAERTAELREANQELEAFSYSVSHDLRAPLAAISGFSRALQDRGEASGDERSLHYLTRIQAGVRKMEELIEALLQLSRVVRAQVESGPVDLTQLAHETVESLRMQDPHRTVAVRIEDGLAARGDLRLLRAVIENLVGNAWKFTAHAAPALIEVGRNEEGAYFVRDNGAGFDMAYADKLFTAFHRLHKDSEFPGTGIGLATVRRVITRHHGKVWAESAPGRGTTFYFTL